MLTDITPTQDENSVSLLNELIISGTHLASGVGDFWSGGGPRAVAMAAGIAGCSCFCIFIIPV